MMKPIEPVWEVPRLLYTNRGTSDEEKTFITDYLAEHYPEVEEFVCIEFIQGDLNNDGRQDIAFVVDSNAFEGPAAVLAEDRRMFILLQQNDGSWVELEDTPRIPSAQCGGMRGDPYYGSFMQDGYLVIKEGWGSRDGTVQTEFYEYQNGSLSLVKQINVDDDNFADGYDVRVTNVRDNTWQEYVIAMDGYRMVRVDLADSEHLTHKGFPEISLYDMSYYIIDDKVESQIISSEALDRVLEVAVEDAALAVREELPYVEWQKDGYELLLGVTLPDHYYVMPETQSEADAEGTEGAEKYLCYEGVTWEDGRLYHRIHLITVCQSSYGPWHRKREFLLDDATGEIREK